MSQRDLANVGAQFLKAFRHGVHLVGLGQGPFLGDGVAGQLQGVLLRERKKRMITTLEEVVEIYKAAHETSQEAYQLDPFVYWPKPKDEATAQFRLLKLSSLPVQLQSTHQFSWTIADSRSISLCGRGHEALVVKGVLCKAHTLPGMRSTQELTCHNVLVASDGQDEAGPDGAASGDELQELTDHTRDYQGWRVSYRKAAFENELKDPKLVRRRLTRKVAVFGRVRQALPALQRHGTLEPTKKYVLNLRMRKRVTARALRLQRARERAAITQQDVVAPVPGHVQQQ